jgi:DNA mismatch repair protein MutS
LFATHFHEMTALSETLGRLHNATMRVKEWDGEVIFLHEVGRGAADRSYGIQVAKLAGLPEAVIERAREVLDLLEQGGQTGKAGALIDDLPLFTAEVKRGPPAAKANDELKQAVEALDPDAMTPREALDALYRLKGLAGDDGG